MLRRLLVVVLALSMVGCAFTVDVLKSRKGEDNTRNAGLALVAYRATCSVDECAGLLRDLGVKTDPALQACTLASLTQATSCGGDE